MTARPPAPATPRLLGRWVVLRRRLFALAATGLALFALIHRAAFIGALTWALVAAAAVAVSAVSYRLITRGSGSDLGLCGPFHTRSAIVWVLVIAVGGHTVQALTSPGAWQPVDAALRQVTASTEPVTLIAAIVAVAITSVAAEFVRLGLIHRGIRDAAIGATGRWIAVGLGITAQLAVLILTGFVQREQVATAVFCVITASIAYELTGSFWVPALGQSLHAAFYLALAGIVEPGAPTVAVTVLALLVIPALALLLAVSLGRTLGTTSRIAAVP